MFCPLLLLHSGSLSWWSPQFIQGPKNHSSFRILSLCSSGKQQMLQCKMTENWAQQRRQITHSELLEMYWLFSLTAPQLYRRRPRALRRLAVGGGGRRFGGGRGWEPRHKLFSPVEEEVEGPLPLCTKPGTMGGREESTHTQWVGRGVEVEVEGWRGLLDGWRMWDSGCRAAADRQQWRRRRKRRRAGSTGEVLLTESNASFCISTSEMLAVFPDVPP